MRKAHVGLRTEANRQYDYIVRKVCMGKISYFFTTKTYYQISNLTSKQEGKYETSAPGL